MGRGKRRATNVKAVPMAQGQARAAAHKELRPEELIAHGLEELDSGSELVETRQARRHKGHLHGRLDRWVVEPCGHPHLPRTALDSSLLTSVGYDDEKRILEVEFHAGGIYHYRGVPVEAYEGLFTAPSVGKYFNDEIKANYPDTAIHSSEYKETPAYLDFCNKHLNMDYVYETARLSSIVDEIQAMPAETEISIDFETAIDSYSDKTRGALRLVQLGVEAPKGQPFLTQEGKQKQGKQWVIDCFRVDPTRVIEVFQSDNEKFIHYLFFEQDWATGRFGSPIKNIFDSCLAWRGIQSYMTNALRALDHAYRGENVPRSVRRVLGCTVTNREYRDRFDEDLGFGPDAELDYELGSELQRRPNVPGIEQETGEPLDERPMTDEEYEAFLDEDVVALGEVTEEENFRVHTRVLPRIADMLKAAKFELEPLETADVVARLAEPLGYDEAQFAGDDPELVAQFLMKKAAENRAEELPKLLKPTKLTDDMSEAERAQVEEENRLVAEENLEIEAERQAIRERNHKTPVVLPVELNGVETPCAFPDYNIAKRSATSFHPNTLAYVTKKILGFEIPKTEQAGYWGRPTLTSNQVVYSAVDVAVLPPIVRETKRIVAELGIEDEVYRRRIGASERRVAERVQKKLDDGAYIDHYEKAETALRRAVSLGELEDAWHSFRQLALYFPSFKKIAAVYEERKKELESPRKSRSRQAQPTPF